MSAVLTSCPGIWCDTPVLRPGLRLPGVALPVYPRQTRSTDTRVVNNTRVAVACILTVDARLRLECGEGHVSRGQLEISCQANGVWSRAEGACHRISCGRPRSEPGATLLAASWVYGARVPFSCPSGQLPVNSPLLCTKDGTWTNEPAKCSPLH